MFNTKTKKDILLLRTEVKSLREQLITLKSNVIELTVSIGNLQNKLALLEAERKKAVSQKDNIISSEKTKKITNKKTKKIQPEKSNRIKRKLYINN